MAELIEMGVEVAGHDDHAGAADAPLDQQCQLRSGLTLFAAVRKEPFETALRHFYAGQPDTLTLELLDAA